MTAAGASIWPEALAINIPGQQTLMNVNADNIYISLDSLHATVNCKSAPIHDCLMTPPFIASIRINAHQLKSSSFQSFIQIASLKAIIRALFAIGLRIAITAQFSRIPEMMRRIADLSLLIRLIIRKTKWS